MPPAGHGLGNHYGQIRHAGNSGSIDIVEDESELPLEALAGQLLGRMREIQLHLVVDVTLVFRMIVWVVPVAMLLDVREKFAGLLVVRLHLGAAQLVVRQRQHEIHFVESARMHRLADGVVA